MKEIVRKINSYQLTLNRMKLKTGFRSRNMKELREKANALFEAITHAKAENQSKICPSKLRKLWDISRFLLFAYFDNNKTAYTADMQIAIDTMLDVIAVDNSNLFEQWYLDHRIL